MSLLSSQRSPHQVDTCESFESSIPEEIEQFAKLPAIASVSTIKTDRARSSLSTEQLVREAVLLTFCDPPRERCLRLQNLSKREWTKLLDWLDISGLALYFLDRMTELQWWGILPPSVLARLQQNLIDNTERTLGMIAESSTIQQAFQEAHLSYAVLKGFSLCPSSVPKPELRHQLDLDFLVAERSAPEARRILEHRGYRLYAISGRSWEFKINEVVGISTKDLYRNLSSWSLELHIEANDPSRPLFLERIEKREFHGINMPLLSPVDLFLGQGLHAYKHICSEFSRTAHFLEFRRHVLARYNDDSFWGELQSLAEESSGAPLRLGVVTLLVTRAMGAFAPEVFTSWTVDRLPHSARLWVEIYGCHSVFGSFPGSKLYLLLQKELESSGVQAKRSLRQALLPSRLPPSVVKTTSNEAPAVRIRRYRVQFQFILIRLHFHIQEGVRYAWESYRWKREKNRLTP